MVDRARVVVRSDPLPRRIQNFPTSNFEPPHHPRRRQSSQSCTTPGSFWDTFDKMCLFPVEGYQQMLIRPSDRARYLGKGVKGVIYTHSVLVIAYIASSLYVDGIVDLLGVFIGYLSIRNARGFNFQQVLCYSLYLGMDCFWAAIRAGLFFTGTSTAMVQCARCPLPMLCQASPIHRVRASHLHPHTHLHTHTHTHQHTHPRTPTHTHTHPHTHIMHNLQVPARSWQYSIYAATVMFSMPFYFIGCVR